MKSINFTKMKKMVMVFAIALLGSFVFCVTASADTLFPEGRKGYRAKTVSVYTWQNSGWYDNGTTYEYTYDKYGNITKNSGLSYKYKYDKKGNMIECKEYGNIGERSYLRYTEVYTYNKKGYLVKNKHVAEDVMNYSKYKYDKKGNLIKRVTYSKKGKKVCETNYSYTFKNGVMATCKIVEKNLSDNSKRITNQSYYQSGYRKGYVKEESIVYKPDKLEKSPVKTTYTYKPDKTGKHVGTCIVKSTSDGYTFKCKYVYTWKKLK